MDLVWESGTPPTHIWEKSPPQKVFLVRGLPLKGTKTDIVPDRTMSVFAQYLRSWPLLCLHIAGWDGMGTEQYRTVSGPPPSPLGLPASQLAGLFQWDLSHSRSQSDPKISLNLPEGWNRIKCLSMTKKFLPLVQNVNFCLWRTQCFLAYKFKLGILMIESDDGSGNDEE